MAPDALRPREGEDDALDDETLRELRAIVIPGIPEGLIVLRYGTATDPADRMLLCDGKLINPKGLRNEGLIVHVARGYQEFYIPSEDKCLVRKVVRKAVGPKTITATFIVTDAGKGERLLQVLDEMGAKIT